MNDEIKLSDQAEIIAEAINTFYRTLIYDLDKEYAKELTTKYTNFLFALGLSNQCPPNRSSLKITKLNNRKRRASSL